MASPLVFNVSPFLIFLKLLISYKLNQESCSDSGSNEGVGEEQEYIIGDVTRPMVSGFLGVFCDVVILSLLFSLVAVKSK